MTESLQDIQENETQLSENEFENYEEIDDQILLFEGNEDMIKSELIKLNALAIEFINIKENKDFEEFVNDNSCDTQIASNIGLYKGKYRGEDMIEANKISLDSFSSSNNSSEKHVLQSSTENLLAELFLKYRDVIEWRIAHGNFYQRAQCAVIADIANNSKCEAV